MKPYFMPLIKYFITAHLNVSKAFIPISKKNPEDKKVLCPVERYSTVQSPLLYHTTAA